MELARLGIDRQALAAGLHRGVDPGAFQHQHGKIGVGGHVAGTKPDDPTQRRLGLPHLAQPVENDGEVEPEVGLTRRPRQRRPVDLLGLAQAPGVAQHDPQRAGGGDGPGRGRQGVAIGRFGGRGIAAHMLHMAKIAVEIRDAGPGGDGPANEPGAVGRPAALRH